MKRLVILGVLMAVGVIIGEKTYASGSGGGYTQFKVQQIKEAREAGLTREEMKMLKGQNIRNHR